MADRRLEDRLSERKRTQRMAEEKVEIFVNGEPRRVPVGQTVSGLLTDLELNGRLVVVELNRQILRRGELPEIGLEAGDRVELVNFVGGG